MLFFLRKWRIQKQLFIYYSILILGIILLLAIILNIYFSRLIKDATSETALRLTNNIATKLDARIEQMDNLAKRVVFSDSITENFLSRNEGSNLLLPLTTRRGISMELQSLLGPSFDVVDQVNLINCQNGNYISAGSRPLHTLIAHSELDSAPWIQQTLAGNGLMVVVPPHTEDWSGYSGSSVFSVARSFKSPTNPAQQGIVQTSCSTGELERIVGETLADVNIHKNLFVFAGDGYPVYASGRGEAALYWEALQDGNEEEIVYSDGELLSYTTSGYSGWTVLLVVDEKQVTSPASTFYVQILWILLAAIPATLLLSYVLSRRFTRPIQSIYNEIGKLELRNRAGAVALPGAAANELDELLETFKDLCRRLESLIDEAAAARSYEYEARMKALQTQINPHFLYNTFAVIQTMADEMDAPEIAEISDGMAAMLRYALAKDSPAATIKSEMQITSTFLDMMYTRYRGQVAYSLQMDPGLEAVRVPRMILQPIVENCFKHAFQDLERWEVHVRCSRREDGGWSFEVRDNGKGFDAAVISRLERVVPHADAATLSKINEDAGMGLVNVGVRFRLEYGRRSLFQVENIPGGGGKVTIGVRGDEGDSGEMERQDGA